MAEFAIASLIGSIMKDGTYLSSYLLLSLSFNIYLIFTELWLFLLISFELHPVIGMSMSNLLILSMVASTSIFWVFDVLP